MNYPVWALSSLEFTDLIRTVKSFIWVDQLNLSQPGLIKQWGCLQRQRRCLIDSTTTIEEQCLLDDDDVDFVDEGVVGSRERILLMPVSYAS